MKQEVETVITHLVLPMFWKFVVSASAQNEEIVALNYF